MSVFQTFSFFVRNFALIGQYVVEISQKTILIWQQSAIRICRILILYHVTVLEAKFASALVS